MDVAFNRLRDCGYILSLFPGSFDQHAGWSFDSIVQSGCLETYIKHSLLSEYLFAFNLSSIWTDADWLSSLTVQQSKLSKYNCYSFSCETIMTRNLNFDFITKNELEIHDETWSLRYHHTVSCQE